MNFSSHDRERVFGTNPSIWIQEFIMKAASVALLISISALFTAATASAQGNACALLTQTQVSAALGVPVAAGNNFGEADACQWKGGAGANLRVVDFAILDVESFNGGKMMAGLSSKVKLEPVSGVGDDAYYLTTGPIITLGVKKGSTAFKFYFQHAGGLSVDQVKAKEKTLASDVLAKL